MPRWDYELPRFSEIREEMVNVDESNSVDIKEFAELLLHFVTHDLKEAVGEELYQEEFRGWLIDLEEIIDDYEYWDDYEEGLDDVTECLNNLIHDFYNVCDILRIWLGI